ncbi:MAG: response regulator [Candidatus Kapabacteria bacterium]|nr:response regulator [Candidatus Kapabacteria bacterium]
MTDQQHHIQSAGATSLLLIEDNDLQAALITKQLEEAASTKRNTTHEEITIKHVHNLAVGMALLRDTTFDAVLLDLTLPDSAGLSTLETLRQEQRSIPIVVITGDETYLTAQLAIHYKAQEYVVKGEYTGHSLLRSVYNAIERQKMYDALNMSREQIIRSEYFHRHLVEQLPQGIVIIDNDSRILYINPQAEQMLGKSNGELTGELITVPILLDTDMDIAIPSSDGTLRYAIARTMKTLWEGQDARLLTLHDITDRKQLESQLLRSQRMETLGTLAGGIAHDLNNLLSPILLGVQALSRSLQEERHQKILNMIEQSTRRGADLVRQVLNFARGSDTRREIIELERTLQYVDVVQRRKNLTSHPIKVINNTARGTEIITDAESLHTCLNHIISNAAESSDDGSPVTVLCELIHSDLEFRTQHKGAKEGTFVCINVIDEGSGISDDVRTHIFEPFYTTKDVAQHSGLGLYATLAAVKRMNGFMEVDSVVGKGTTVRLYVPLAGKKSEIEGVYNVTKGYHYGNSETILVLDENSTIREMAMETLRMYGYNVIVASSHAEAVNELINNAKLIDCVLLDIPQTVQPSADEHTKVTQLITKLRQIDIGLDVVVTCGLLDQRFSDDLKQQNVRAFLAKPYTTESLLNTLHEVMKK